MCLKMWKPSSDEEVKNVLRMNVIKKNCVFQAQNQYNPN